MKPSAILLWNPTIQKLTRSHSEVRFLGGSAISVNLEKTGAGDIRTTENQICSDVSLVSVEKLSCWGGIFRKFEPTTRNLQVKQCHILTILFDTMSYTHHLARY